MTAIKNFSFALALALGATAAGCASDSGDSDGGGDGDGGGGGGSAKQMDASGRYSMESTFDIASNMPGKVGAVTNAFIAMTDGGSDPADWLLEQMIAKMPNGTMKSFLSSARPFVAGYLNDRLLQIAPDFVDTMVQVGNDFGQVAKGFGLKETLEISGSPGAYSSKITAVGIHTKIDNIEMDVSFQSASLPDVSASAAGAADAPGGIGVAVDSYGKIDISQHKLPLSYGKVLKLTLDKVIIPAVDQSATNLQTLLKSLINCAAVGVATDAAIKDQFGYGGGASFWTAACTVGLDFGAAAVYGKMDSIDTSALEFGLAGTAQAVDTDGDKLVDRIQTGTWAGTLSYSGTPAPLAAATFTAERL